MLKTPADSCAELGVAKNKLMAKGGWQEFSRPESLQRGMPASDPTPKNQQRVRVQRTKAGKGGKMVTAITGLERRPASRCADLALPPVDLCAVDRWRKT